MKKAISSLVAVIVLSIAIASCGNKEHDRAEHNASSSEVYTCPMHPEVTSDKPGSCPKCGMDLVKKETIKNEAQPDSTMKGDSSMKM
jgi:Cu(I)/Ag(I) efflux system membrane fusion protein